ncbi:hypothetical protein BA70_18225 [Bacillus zhangzhouensis]|uniref:Uncharacterized protein n=1 Tax=Bacillus zhangzhouensis TaxID=1178540 RepID=A0A081LC45_9BACI|nr:hypothetical protein BA70_18225 [Bacillus zhangzhouensis]
MMYNEIDDDLERKPVLDHEAEEIEKRILFLPCLMTDEKKKRKVAFSEMKGLFSVDMIMF